MWSHLIERECQLGFAQPSQLIGRFCRCRGKRLDLVRRRESASEQLRYPGRRIVVRLDDQHRLTQLCRGKQVTLVAFDVAKNNVDLLAEAASTPVDVHTLLNAVEAGKGVGHLACTSRKIMGVYDGLGEPPSEADRVVAFGASHIYDGSWLTSDRSLDSVVEHGLIDTSELRDRALRVLLESFDHPHPGERPR